jgi:hypothetical protein
MSELNHEEWGATVLGFSGFFLGMGVLALGMLPFWVVLIPAVLAFGIIMALTAALHQAAAYWPR